MYIVNVLFMTKVTQLILSSASVFFYFPSMAKKTFYKISPFFVFVFRVDVFICTSPVNYYKYCLREKVHLLILLECL